MADRGEDGGGGGEEEGRQLGPGAGDAQKVKTQVNLDAVEKRLFLVDSVKIN